MRNDVVKSENRVIREVDKKRVVKHVKIILGLTSSRCSLWVLAGTLGDKG
jgi:hypothetical protein